MTATTTTATTAATATITLKITKMSTKPAQRHGAKPPAWQLRRAWQLLVLVQALAMAALTLKITKTSAKPAQRHGVKPPVWQLRRARQLLALVQAAVGLGEGLGPLPGEEGVGERRAGFCRGGGGLWQAALRRLPSGRSQA